MGCNDMERIREALGFVPPDGREAWVRMGMAVKAELGDTGFDLWDAWSQQADSYSPNDAKSVWKSIHDGGKVTAGTLFHEAKANGWRDDGTHQKPTPEELAERRRIAAERSAKEEADTARQQAEAAEKAAITWESAQPAPADHAYLTRKGIQAHGVRCHKGALLIPLRAGGNLHSLQCISEDGGKRFLAGGRVAGCYFSIGNPKGAVALCIAEGFATGASIHEATGYPVAVVFNAGNLLTVAQAMRERFPDLPLILCADDDAATPGNPGMTKATEAARAVGGKVAVPHFGNGRPDGASDFNDMAALMGPEAVGQCIEAAQGPGVAPAENQEDDRATVRALAGVQHDTPTATSRGSVKAPGKAAPANSDDEALDHHRNQPRPAETMLYGLAGDVGKTAAATTEANQYAVTLNYMAYLSAMVGRDVYLPVGNTWHHCRLFTLHIGRSGRGRKGDAVSIVHRIRHAVNSMVEAGIPGQVHVGGLSTREGLALMVHDGYTDGKEEVPPIEDKRLWVVESEFVNVLHQGKRDGNTLSAALRDCWDGVSLRPATKTGRIWATDPHIALSGAITPSELRGVMQSRELTNGFANRFMMIWAERQKLIPFPTATPQEVVSDLAGRTAEVIRFAKGGYPGTKDQRRMSLAADAQDLYATLYRGELSQSDDGGRIDALLERRAPMLLRMAMLFALSDMALVIERHHINAALAWVRYWRDSVKFVFSEEVDETVAVIRSETAEKIVDWLKVKGDTSRSALNRDCFKSHVSSSKLDEALSSLLEETPPRIEVIDGPPRSNGRPAKLYRACVTGVSGVVALSARVPATTHPCVVGVVAPHGNAPTTPTTPSTQLRKPAETPANRATTPITPVTQPCNEKMIEVEI